MKNRIIICGILLSILITMCCSAAFATDDMEISYQYSIDMEVKSLRKEALRKEVSEILTEFPDAELSVENAILGAEYLYSLSTEKQIEYYEELFENGPVQSLIKYELDGSYVQLNVYAPMVTETKRVIPGASVSYNDITYYTGTKIQVDNLCGYSQVNVYYYVDHNLNYDTGVGQVTNVYSFSGHGSWLITSGNYHYTQTTGSRAVVQVEIFSTGIGSDNVPTSFGFYQIAFNASSFNISTGWV